MIFDIKVELEVYSVLVAVDKLVFTDCLLVGELNYSAGLLELL